MNELDIVMCVNFKIYAFLFWILFIFAFVTVCYSAVRP